MRQKCSNFYSEELRNANVKKNGTADHDLGLYLDAYVTCDGFTYNVTRMAGPPPPEELKLRSASQWAILSRDFVEDLVDQVLSISDLLSNFYVSFCKNNFIYHLLSFLLNI